MFNKRLVNNKHRYKTLLISLIGFIFISPLLPEGLLGDVLIAGLFFLVIFSASFNLPAHAPIRWFLIFSGIASLGFGALGHNSLYFDLLSRVMMLLFFCSTIWVFGRDVFSVQPQRDHIYGAIIIYFLIGIVYAILYLFFQKINPYEIVIGNTGLPVTKPFDLYYFSFITLSTVGYGDVIAQGQFAKIVCMLESMTGLFYFAILVSSLIGFFQSQKQVVNKQNTTQQQ